MLVLTRKPGQEIRIGTDIVVTILECKGGQIRLGIAAPREVAVRRETGSTPVKDLLGQAMPTPSSALSRPEQTDRTPKLGPQRSTCASSTIVSSPRRPPLSERLRRNPALRSVSA